jgi:hypothetical protein
LVGLIAMLGAQPPPHIHHGADETYYFLDGELVILGVQCMYTAMAGSTVDLAKGAVYAWRNASTQAA